MRKYTNVSGEFESMEQAEAAARMLRENLDGKKKITIVKNQGRYRGCAQNSSDITISEGDALLVFPYSTHSHNFLSGMFSRKADESQINELLLTKSVTAELICEESQREKALQIFNSFGGYSIKG